MIVGGAIVCHPVDVVGVIVVGGQGYGAPKCGGGGGGGVDDDWRKAASAEVGLEIIYAAVAFEYGLEGLELDAGGVLGGVL